MQGNGVTRIVRVSMVAGVIVLGGMSGSPNEAQAAAADWNCDQVDMTITAANSVFRPGSPVPPSHVEQDFTGSGTAVCSRTTGPTTSSPWVPTTLTMSGEMVPEHCTNNSQMYTVKSTVTVSPSGEPAFTTSISLKVAPSTTRAASGRIELGSGQIGTVEWLMQPSDPSFPGRCDREFTTLAGEAKFQGPVATDRVVQDETTPPAKPMPEPAAEPVADNTDLPMGAGDLLEADVVAAMDPNSSFTTKVEFPPELLEAPAQEGIVAAASTNCVTSLGISAFIRYAPDPNKAGFKWTGKGTCTGSETVTQSGSSTAHYSRTNQRVASGDVCTTVVQGFPCRTKGGYLQKNTRRHHYYILLNYYREGRPGTRWRRTANDTNGIDQKSCSGYGTNVLACTYSRAFSAGIR